MWMANTILTFIMDHILLKTRLDKTLLIEGFTPTWIALQSKSRHYNSPPSPQTGDRE